MGGCTSSKREPTQTEIKLFLDHGCQQAGSAVKGRLQLVLGEAQRELFRQFDQGVVLAIRLVGEERIFWASGQQHNPQATKAVKHLVDGNLRRESSRLIINEELQLRQFNYAQLEQSRFKVEVPFSMPLPDDLPPSMYYCGQMMSCLSIQYRLTGMMLGLKSGGQQSATPHTQLVIQQQQNLFLRELDPVGQAPITVKTEGKVTSAFGLLGKGQTKVEGQLLTPRTHQNAEAMIRLAIDNSQCGKMVANVKFQLKRTITAYGFTSEKKKKEFKDEQEVMFGKFEDQVAKNEPNLSTRDYAVLIKKTQGTDREVNRVLLLKDFEKGTPLSVPLRQMQHDVLPSVNTPNLKIEYEIISMVSHEGMFSASQDVPSVHMPLYVTVDPKGPFDLGREGHQLAEERRQMQRAIAESQRSHDAYVKQRSFVKNQPGPQLLEQRGFQPQPAAAAAGGADQKFNVNQGPIDHEPIAGLPVDEEPMIHDQYPGHGIELPYGEPVYMDHPPNSSHPQMQADEEIINPQDMPTCQERDFNGGDQMPMVMAPDMGAARHDNGAQAAMQYPQI